MKLSKFLKSVAAAALVGGIALSGAIADANAKTRLKIQSAFPKKIFVIGPGPYNVADTLKATTDGNVALKIFEPGALVAATKTYDATATGAIDGAWTTPGYHVSKDIAYAFFSAVPFGPRGGEYLAWMRYGGGQDLADELYGANGIKHLVCNMIPPETSGWFRSEVKSLAELKGIKMRFFGLGAKVMEKFGVSTQLLAGGDIYPALELGTIDATEFSMPAIDRDFGFYQIAKHNYFPGWHQQSTLGSMEINAKKYAKLSKEEQEAFDAACDRQVLHSFVEGEAGQFEAMAFHQSKGVTLHRWPEDILDQLRKGWEEVAAEETKNSPAAKKVYASYTEFRNKYAVWKDMGYLN